MGKLVIAEFMTLNGVFEAPEKWSLDYFDAAIGDYKLAELQASDALLLGRTTYDTFAQAWPGRTDDTGFAEKINTMPKYLVSASDDAPWQNTKVISGDLEQRVPEIKQAHDGDILVNGSGELANALLAAGLVDQLNLIIYPVVRAGGKLFADGTMATFQLTESRAFDSGPILTVYTTKQTASR